MTTTIQETTKKTGEMTTSPTRSAQGQAIVEGKNILHGTVTDRVLRVFEAIRSYRLSGLALERAIYFTESFKATEVQPRPSPWPLSTCRF